MQVKIMEGANPFPEHQLMLIIDESVGRCQRASGHRWFDSSRPALPRESGLTFNGNLAGSVWHNPSGYSLCVVLGGDLKATHNQRPVCGWTNDQRLSALFLRSWGEMPVLSVLCVMHETTKKEKIACQL